MKVCVDSFHLHVFDKSSVEVKRVRIKSDDLNIAFKKDLHKEKRFIK